MTAIEKMVEWLENYAPWYNNDNRKVAIVKEILIEARRLAEEEKARIHLDDVNREAAMRPLIEENRRLKAQVLAQEEKAKPTEQHSEDVMGITPSGQPWPTPPKEATAGLIDELKAWIKDSVLNGYATTTGAHQLLDIIIRYRPATPSEGLVDMVKEIREYMYRSATNLCEIDEIDKIISRHTGGKGVGV